MVFPVNHKYFRSVPILSIRHFLQKYTKEFLIYRTQLGLKYLAVVILQGDCVPHLLHLLFVKLHAQLAEDAKKYEERLQKREDDLAAAHAADWPATGWLKDIFWAQIFPLGGAL